MPIVFDGNTPHGAAPAPAGLRPRVTRQPRGAAASDCIEIGLLNNMPDAALRRTEQQFIELLAAAAGRTSVRLHFFSLPDVARSELLGDHMRQTYADISELERTRLDALIVTGNEPRAAFLSDEPYWKSLTDIVDWAEQNTVSTIFSCLAAHAAVLHLDGIERRRLPQKCSGVFRCLPVAEHPLLAKPCPSLMVPHSRWNDLAEGDLAANGYTVLTRTGDGAVDMFVKQWNSLFVFFQGHPEYHVDSLLREYRRDIGRFLRGEIPHYPTMPSNYFSRRTEVELARLAARATREGPAALLAETPRTMSVRPPVAARWRVSVIPVWRNWLGYVAARKLGG